MATGKMMWARYSRSAHMHHLAHVPSPCPLMHVLPPHFTLILALAITIPTIFRN